MAISFFFAGMAFITFALAGLLFLKLWRASGDRLFKFLCAACWMLSVERVAGVLTVFYDVSEIAEIHSRSLIYLIRLVAFFLILVSVVDKNRSVQRH